MIPSIPVSSSSPVPTPSSPISSSSLVPTPSLATAAAVSFTVPNALGSLHPGVVLSRSSIQRMLAQGQRDFTGVSFNGLDLSHVVLSDCNLTNATFIGCTLHGVTFRGADLTGANLSGASLVRAYFKHANLTGANLSGASLVRASMVDTDLSAANLTGASLFQCVLKRVRLCQADLTDSNLLNAKIVDTDLSAANLTRAKLRYAVLRHINLTGAILDQTDVRAAKMEGVKLTQRDFYALRHARHDALTSCREIDLSPDNVPLHDGSDDHALGADAMDRPIGDMSGLEMPNSLLHFGVYVRDKFVQTNLESSSCIRADFSEADLTGAILRRSIFDDAILIRANLTGADLTRADLTGANLTAANFTAATLSHTRFDRTVLRQACMAWAKVTLITDDPATIKDRAMVMSDQFRDTHGLPIHPAHPQLLSIHDTPPADPYPFVFSLPDTMSDDDLSGLSFRNQTITFSLWERLLPHLYSGEEYVQVRVAIRPSELTQSEVRDKVYAWLRANQANQLYVMPEIAGNGHVNDILDWLDPARDMMGVAEREQPVNRDHMVLTQATETLNPIDAIGAKVVWQGGHFVVSIGASYSADALRHVNLDGRLVSPEWCQQLIAITHPSLSTLKVAVSSDFHDSTIPQLCADLQSRGHCFWPVFFSVSKSERLVDLSYRATCETILSTSPADRLQMWQQVAGTLPDSSLFDVVRTLLTQGHTSN